MDSAFSPIFLIALFIVLIAWGIWFEKQAKEIVRNDLERKGCQEIEVTRAWAFGRRELSYDAKYRNSQGQLVVNSCIVAAGFFSPGDVYWKNPI